MRTATTPRPTAEEREAAWDHHRQRQQRVMLLGQELGFPELGERLGEVVKGRWTGGRASFGYAVTDATPEELADMETRLLWRRELAPVLADYEGR